jgi:hypothetical protein
MSSLESPFRNFSLNQTLKQASYLPFSSLHSRPKLFIAEQFCNRRSKIENRSERRMSILVGQPRGDVIVFGHRCKRQSRRRTFLKSLGEMKFRWLSVFHIYMGIMWSKFVKMWQGKKLWFFYAQNCQKRCAFQPNLDTSSTFKFIVFFQ